MDNHHQIHKYYDAQDPNLQHLTLQKKKNYSRSKKIAIRVIVVLAFFAAEAGFLWMSADSKITYSPVKAEVVVGVKPPKPAVQAEKPIEKIPALAVADMYLVIPKLFVNAPIDPVGVDEKGNMASPTSLQRITWYKDGTKPGALGSAVFAGHYGGPQEIGIFRSIDRLSEGDIIEVRTKDAQSLKYKVYKKAVYQVVDVPLQDLFNKNDGKYINLVTCVGNWDQNSSSYDQRLIVYAKQE